MNYHPRRIVYEEDLFSLLSEEEKDKLFRHFLNRLSIKEKRTVHYLMLDAIQESVKNVK